MATAPIVIAVPTPVVIAPPAVDPRASEIELVFALDHVSYVKLADIGESGELMPAHGKAKLVHGDGEASVVEVVNAADMPPALRAWQGRKVVVDGTCSATVTGFAVVAHLAGDPSYAGSGETWDAAGVLEHGAPVIAARLDHCSGTYARDAALSTVIVPTTVYDEELVKVAKARVIASSPADAAQSDWLAQGHTGHWYDDAALATQVVRHPKTGVTFVSVHASIEEGCGGAHANIWGLFRVASDHTLVAVELRDLGELTSVDKLIDIEGDGELEVIGHPWLGADTLIARHDGTLVQHFERRFYGCPC